MSVRDMHIVGSFRSLCHTLLVDVMKFRAYSADNWLTVNSRYQSSGVLFSMRRVVFVCVRDDLAAPPFFAVNHAVCDLAATLGKGCICVNGRAV